MIFFRFSSLIDVNMKKKENEYKKNIKQHSIGNKNTQLTIDKHRMTIIVPFFKTIMTREK